MTQQFVVGAVDTLGIASPSQVANAAQAAALALNQILSATGGVLSSDFGGNLNVAPGIEQFANFGFERGALSAGFNLIRPSGGDPQAQGSLSVSGGGPGQFFSSDEERVNFVVQGILKDLVAKNAISGISPAVAAVLSAGAPSLQALGERIDGVRVQPIDLTGRNIISIPQGVIPSFDTGGSRTFTRPTLISVAEHGPERVRATPSGSPISGGAGINLIFNDLAILDDITAATAARRIMRALRAQEMRVV